jgi:hypothetical protein
MSDSVLDRLVACVYAALEHNAGAYVARWVIRRDGRHVRFIDEDIP